MSAGGTYVGWRRLTAADQWKWCIIVYTLHMSAGGVSQQPTNRSGVSSRMHYMCEINSITNVQRRDCIDQMCPASIERRDCVDQMCPASVERRDCVDQMCRASVERRDCVYQMCRASVERRESAWDSVLLHADLNLHNYYSTSFGCVATTVKTFQQLFVSVYDDDLAADASLLGPI